MRSPSAKNSSSAKTATMAANPATSQVGDHQIAAATAGMSAAAVTTRSCVPELIQILSRFDRISSTGTFAAGYTTRVREISLASLQRLNRLRKNALSDLQGLKPLKETRTLCRACRHDPQDVRLFPQRVKPRPSKI